MRLAGLCVQLQLRQALDIKNKKANGVCPQVADLTQFMLLFCLVNESWEVWLTGRKSFVSGCQVPGDPRLDLTLNQQFSIFSKVITISNHESAVILCNFRHFNIDWQRLVCYSTCVLTVPMPKFISEIAIWSKVNFVDMYKYLGTWQRGVWWRNDGWQRRCAWLNLLQHVAVCAGSKAVGNHLDTVHNAHCIFYEENKEQQKTVCYEFVCDCCEWWGEDLSIWTYNRWGHEYNSSMCV